MQKHHQSDAPLDRSLDLLTVPLIVLLTSTHSTNHWVNHRTTHYMLTLRFGIKNCFLCALMSKCQKRYSATAATGQISQSGLRNLRYSAE